MAALDTVSAIPRDRQTDSDASDGKKLVGKYIAFKANGMLHKGRVIDFSGGKHSVRYDDGTQRKHLLKNGAVGTLSRIDPVDSFQGEFF